MEYFDEIYMRNPHGVTDCLKKASVAIAGCGGLGSTIAVALARSGVGNMLLVDYDEVEASNLNRQQFLKKHIGMKKAEALKSIIAEINPLINVRAVDAKITENNCIQLFSDYNYICEAFDKPECKAEFVGAILSAFPQKKLVAASGMAGYGNASKIITKKISDNFYICGDGVSSFEQGIMAPCVWICAAHQADKIIELILNDNGGKQ